jgi:hypothetical protein
MSLVIDTATPSLEALSKKLKQRKRIHTAMAGAVANQFRAHFKSLSKSNKNKFGAKNSFWDRMRSSIREEATDTVSAISMDRAVALRRFGGIVKPTGGRKFLTIPISAKAHGKKATEFADESFIWPPQAGTDSISRIVKAYKEKYIAIIDDSGKLELLYRLVRSTKHKPNSLAIPSDNDVQRIVFGTLAKHLSNG